MLITTAATIQVRSPCNISCGLCAPDRDLIPDAALQQLLGLLLHANTSQEAFRRLTSPPINLPPDLVRSLPLFAVMFRQRKHNVRRLFEISEISSSEKVEVSETYRWDARSDNQKKENEPQRVLEELRMFLNLFYLLMVVFQNSLIVSLKQI